MIQYLFSTDSTSSNDDLGDRMVQSAYIVSSILFILSLGGLSNQESARKGNLYGILSMFLALSSTMCLSEFEGEYLKFFLTFLSGGLIGTLITIKVEMISMPQLVAGFHSFVGIAAVLVGFANFLRESSSSDAMHLVETYIGIFIGAITFTGSIVACGKLMGKIRSAPLIICGNGRHFLNLIIIVGSVIGCILFCVDPNVYNLLYMTAGAFFFGWHMVMAIGGGDVPVVISMLNSYSGWATAASGFMLDNNLLIITGALVGSSGAILSYIMCKAMNRSFFSVIAGGFGAADGSSAIPDDDDEDNSKRVHTEINGDQAYSMVMKAKSIVIVPGYGMAQARCQENVGRLVTDLRKLGKKVQFCIHPVAGRLPGHMNVLLAEANVPYDIVMEMDEINKDFSNTDLSIIIGANDVVNPLALQNRPSPIQGMPVCHVWEAKHSIVLKRNIGGAGYSGIDNPLFYKANNRMLLGNAFKSIEDLLTKIGSKTGSAAAVTTTADLEMGNTAVAEVQSSEDDTDYPVHKTIGIIKETFAKECRVAVVPATVKLFRKMGFQVRVESGAGDGAGYNDNDYKKKGAVIVSSEEVWTSNVILKVRQVTSEEVEKLGDVECLVNYLPPAQCADLMKELKTHAGLGVVSMNAIPRITSAQKLDSLSSMGNLAGYRATLECFNNFQKFSKQQITAAGKFPPAKVFIIGAGVAGLAAIGTARSLGAVVKAFDSRPACKEQVESMGAEFVEMEYKEDGTGVGGYAKVMTEEYYRQQKLFFARVASEVDIIITTAQIPGKTAPLLLTKDAVRGMKPGSVIFDLAAETGGNCALTKLDKNFVDPQSRVRLLGYSDLVSRMATQASDLYSRNMFNLIQEMCGIPYDKKNDAKNFRFDMDNVIVKSATVVHGGKVTWDPTLPTNTAAATTGKKPAASTGDAKKDLTKPLLEKDEEAGEAGGEAANTGSGLCGSVIQVVVLCVLFALVAYGNDSSKMPFFLTFTLAIFVGYMVIWNVSPALHTPLMSVTNAISGIIVLGSMLELRSDTDEFLDLSSGLAFTSCFFASINVFGGFLVTHRMLSMFTRK